MKEADSQFHCTPPPPSRSSATRNSRMKHRITGNRLVQARHVHQAASTSGGIAAKGDVSAVAVRSAGGRARRVPEWRSDLHMRINPAGQQLLSGVKNGEDVS